MGAAALKRAWSAGSVNDDEVDVASGERERSRPANVVE
jgi:hypothetical protein